MSLDAELEPVAARWWPAAETASTGPWLLRASGGFTGRANSVGVFATTPPNDLDALVVQAEAWYRARGLAPRFQVPETARTAVLRPVLAARGYEPTHGAGYVHVMVRPLDGTLPDPGRWPVTHAGDADDDWVGRWWSVSPRDDLLDEARALLSRVPRPRTFARIGASGAVRAVGLAAVVGGWVGLGAIAVGPRDRRRGLGAAVSAALLRWGREGGAARAFLQVSSDNAAAIALYAGLGFARAYDYRYWLQSPRADADGYR